NLLFFIIFLHGKIASGLFFEISMMFFNILISIDVDVYPVVCSIRGRLENGIYGHSRFCNTDFDDKLACLNLSGV
ncbi:hypothetical protein EGX76_25055, partial [Escherichia coli]|nr:hypothetical protein [Escherichia coli]